VKITSVKTAATSGHCMHLWVRIETDAGITGLGECVHGGYQAIAIIKELEERLIGRDPFAIDAIFEETRRSLVFEGGFAGALITALTGIEIALWDLKGKALKVPIYELMGGKFRDDIRVYCDCEVSPGMNMDEVQAEVDKVLAAGFSALKVDLDIRAYGHTGSETGWYEKDRFNMTPNKWEHDRMVQLAEMVVKAAGKEVEVACDLHTRLDKHSAIRLAKDLEHLQLMWLEEPIPPENIDAMAEITRSTSVPICGGENLYLRHGFRKVFEQQALDIIMPDIPKMRRALRMPQDRRDGRPLFDPVRPAQRLVADRHHGLGAGLRHGAELSGAGVPLVPPRLLVDHHRWWRDHRERPHQADRSAGHRARTERGRGAPAPVPGDDLVRMRGGRPRRSERVATTPTLDPSPQGDAVAPCGEGDAY
jgi:L-alanine-DL-glutamate epimerase-like enolase superfamily enzyme